MKEEDDDDVVKSVLGALWAYLHGKLPLDKDFFNELHSRGLLASNTARELAQLADQGKKDCVWKLVTYMEQFYTEEMLLRLCVFLEEYAQPARPKLATIASRIRQEISKHRPQLPLPVPSEDTLHRSAGVQDGEEVLFPVITPLKQQFSELVSKVFVVINKLNEERMEELHSYLTTLLTDVRHARLPIVPKPVDELKEFLRVRWDELNIQVLESIVKQLKDDKLTEMMMHYQQTLSKEETTSISEHPPAKTVLIVITPEETLAHFKLDRNPDELTLARVFELRRLIHSLVAEPAMFRGFKRGCTVLFFSIPTECVWSLPSCLLPSNLSLLEEWKVLFFSVKGAFTVDIKKRKVIDSLDKEPFLEKIARGREAESISKMQFSTILDPSQYFETARLTSTHPYWRQEPDVPEKMRWPTVVCVEDNIFVCERWNYSSHLCVLNVVTRRWSKLRFHESREMRHTTLATANNQVHCLGGRWRMDGKEEEYSKVVFTLDCDSLQWSDNTLPPLNKGREMATSTSFEGMIFVAGGWGEGSHDQWLSSVEVLSSTQQPSTCNWWEICDLPVGSAHMQCTVSDTDLFVGCGNGTARTIYSCNLSAVKEAMVPGDSTSPESFWHALPETPVKRSGLAIVNNCLVAVGGRNNHGAPSSAVHLYDGCKKTWTIVSDLRKSRRSPFVVFCNFENKHDLFVFGGWGAPTSVESCEVL